MNVVGPGILQCVDRSVRCVPVEKDAGFGVIQTAFDGVVLKYLR